MWGTAIDLTLAQQRDRRRDVTIVLAPTTTWVATRSGRGREPAGLLQRAVCAVVRALAGSSVVHGDAPASSAGVPRARQWCRTRAGPDHTDVQLPNTRFEQARGARTTALARLRHTPP